MKLGFKSEKNELAFSSSVADRWDPPDRGPHMPVSHKQSSGAARHCAATTRRRRASPAMTSTLHDPRDLAHPLRYLVGPLVDANYDAGGHGRSARRDHGGMPVEATAKPKRAQTSIPRLRRTYRTWLHGLWWREVPQPQ